MKDNEMNLITVCTDSYDMVYARKIIQRFKQVTDFNVNAYCITDRPDEVKDICTPIKPPFGSGRGWWNKMYFYSNDMPEGFNLYMDIDTVIIENFDEELCNMIDALYSGRSVSCVSDAIMWKNNKYSSSMMMTIRGKMQDVWEKFDNNKDKLFDYEGGDQVWTGQLLDASRVHYVDETYPKLKSNLKFHLGEKIMGQWNFPRWLPSGTKIVDCGGKPKPHELSNLKYIKENWHDVK